MSETNPSLSLSDPHAAGATTLQKIGLAIFGAGLVWMVVALTGNLTISSEMFLMTALPLIFGGAFVYFYALYRGTLPGIRNDGIMFSSINTRGAAGWITGVVLTGLYICLYWYPEKLEGLVRAMDPLSLMISGQNANQWFLYGTVYSSAILIMGIKAIVKYRHSRYQILRTSSIIFFQLILAYAIPQLLKKFNEPEFYFSYFWPLKPEYFYPQKLEVFWNNPGTLGRFMALWGIGMSFIAVPLLTYYFGKRWYCSWVCGCGGLANTAGDPFRHLSNKSLSAWKFERWMIHSVLVFITVTTGLLWANSAYGGELLGTWSYEFSKMYGFLIGAAFSGVIGVGFYPILGTRVWCRFGCPQAAILGILQKYFSRFRITVNGGQCISCGNCSTYCEMGIDVKWYAQRGQNVIRASCVGCGMCSTVCPRGVLYLENGKIDSRYNDDPLNTLL